MAIENTDLALDGKLIKTTVSIGVASYPQDGSALGTLLAHADRNLYQAKTGGRNRVVQSPDPALAAPSPQ